MLPQLSTCSAWVKDSFLLSSSADFVERRLIRMPYNGRTFLVFGFLSLVVLSFGESHKLCDPVTFIFPYSDVLGWAATVSLLSTNTPWLLGWLRCSQDREAWVMCSGFSEKLTECRISYSTHLPCENMLNPLLWIDGAFPPGLAHAVEG